MFVQKIIDEISQGFIWGFHYRSDVSALDLSRPKQSRICRETLHLEKSKGGLNLVNYSLKMKAFRILIIYKYFDQNYKKWKEILGYWFQVNLFSESRIRWNNSFPHSSDIENVPSFFKQCITEFKDYFRKHRRLVSEKNQHENDILGSSA